MKGVVPPDKVISLLLITRSEERRMQAFLQRFGSMVKGVLSGFDRLRLRGTRRLLANVGGMKHFLWHSQVKLTDFDSYAKETTGTVCKAIERAATDLGRPLVYVANASQNKGELVEKLIQRDGVREGLIALLSCVEISPSYEIFRNKQTHKLELRPKLRKCLHYYHYYLHPQFGLMHTRLQTWFPFTMQVCINGREWLARQLDAAQIGYVRRDNCFVAIADVPAAQKLMDEQLRVNWPAMLEGLARLSDPTHDTLFQRMPAPVYWTVDQSEWATDVMFRSPDDLRALYPRFLRHAIDVFHSEDVLRFLGRRLTKTGAINGLFNEEVTTNLQRRPEGTRIKHHIGVNGLKMYDKAYDAFGAVLRLEATYNNVRNVRVFRTTEGDDKGEKAWLPMRKSVVDLSRRAEVSHKATERYADALATVEDKTPLRELSDKLCQRTHWQGKPVRALRPLAPDDATLLATVARGEFCLDGFRNRDLRQLLYAATAASQAEVRKRSAAVTRKIRILRAHGLIQKVPKSHRYQLTAAGRTATAALLAARQANTAQLSQAA